MAILKHEFDHAGQLQALREELARVPHIANVEMNPTIPHEVMVEYEEHHNVPVRVLDRLSRHGLHPDIQYC